MSIESQTPAQTLTQLVATEIRVQMARADVRQSQLAREIGKTEQWLSVRLRGRQPIDVNDLALIAAGLGIGIHELLPPPDVASRAARPQATAPYLSLATWTDSPPTRPRDNRPPGHPTSSAPTGPGRTTYVPRTTKRRRG